MTTFEQEVAAALEMALIASRWQNYPVQPLARDLAPLVANAIRAACFAIGSGTGDEDEVALAALRGGTP